MKIYDFEVIERCLYWKSQKTLIVGDLHLGYEESLAQRGFSVPKSQLEETISILKKIFEKVEKVEKVILLGDVKHVFGKILNQEFYDFQKLVAFLKENLQGKKEIIITKGNHDTILEPILKNYPRVEMKNLFIQKNILFFHGDKKCLVNSKKIIESNKIKLIIMGHFHPALVLRDKELVKSEKYKCYLYGRSKKYNKKIIYMPSFFPLIEGSDIIKELDIYEKGMNVIAISNEQLYKFNKIS